MEITGNDGLDLGKEGLSLWRIVWLVLLRGGAQEGGGERWWALFWTKLQKYYMDQRSLLKYEFISLIINDEPSIEMPTTDSCTHM